MKMLFLFVSLFLVSIDARPCTTFVLTDHKGNMVFGRNFDFPTGRGHVQINKRNMLKTAFISPPEKALRWTSRYGSITFNQAGREFPYGGMNEAGLVIEQMWLQEARYPGADQRYGLSELQWIQYQLDTSGSVQDVIASDTLVRISYLATSSLHFLIADRLGNVAAVEYIDGKMHVYRGNSLPAPVLANCPYARSLSYQAFLQTNDEGTYNEWTVNSSGRFVKAASLIEDYKNDREIREYAFSILDTVSQAGQTQWSIVYDLKNGVIHWKTFANQKRRVIDIRQFDFSCTAPALYCPIDSSITGKDDFQPYNREENLKLIQEVIASVDFLREHVPPELIEASAVYPESVTCTE